MRLQLWSWNYDPEPTAMGPIAGIWARGLHDRGHGVEVISARPHYPPGVWPGRLLPRRELRDGIRVIRLPLVSRGRSGLARIGEEVTFAASAAATVPFLSRPDVVISVSPSFLGLAPAMALSRLRRAPWVLWLQDILPDAASTTGMVHDGRALRAARAFEGLAYETADRIVVISETFAANLEAKGVAASKIVRIYNPATRGFADRASRAPRARPPRLLYAGNVGHSQGLLEFVRAFSEQEPSNVRLVIAGAGDELSAVRSIAEPVAAIEVLGFVAEQELERELQTASLALVSQRPEVDEFNVPSRLMTFMGRGIPILANVRPDSEVAKLVLESGGGWVVDCADPLAAVALAHVVADDAAELQTRGAAALAYARTHFHPTHMLDQFEEMLSCL